MTLKGLSPGPATSYQQSGDWGLQDSSPADSRTGGLEDWYLSRLEDWKDLTLKTGQWPRSLVAPLPRGRRISVWPYVSTRCAGILKQHSQRVDLKITFGAGEWSLGE